MVDFNGFDKGVIGKKLPSDTTLNNMRKSDLIELLHLAESNHRLLAEVYKIAVDTSKCKSCPLSLDGEESYQKGRADGYSQAENDYHKKTEKDRQSAFDCGYEKGREDAIDECIEILKDTSRRNCSYLLDEIVYRAIEQMENLKEQNNG